MLILKIDYEFDIKKVIFKMRLVKFLNRIVT